jgi:hypothetical protein
MGHSETLRGCVCMHRVTQQSHWRDKLIKLWEKLPLNHLTNAVQNVLKLYMWRMRRCYEWSRSNSVHCYERLRHCRHHKSLWSRDKKEYCLLQHFKRHDTYQQVTGCSVLSDELVSMLPCARRTQYMYTTSPATVISAV